MSDFSFATTRRDDHGEEGQRYGVGKKVKEAPCTHYLTFMTVEVDG
jgi:hypothetical protein